MSGSCGPKKCKICGCVGGSDFESTPFMENTIWCNVCGFYEYACHVTGEKEADGHYREKLQSGELEKIHDGATVVYKTKNVEKSMSKVCLKCDCGHQWMVKDLKDTVKVERSPSNNEPILVFYDCPDCKKEAK